jgi:hypothetical protein
MWYNEVIGGRVGKGWGWRNLRISPLHRKWGFDKVIYNIFFTLIKK